MRIRNATVGGQGVQRGRGREWCVPSGGGGSGDVLAKVTAGNAVCVRRSKVACRVAELRRSFSFPLDARVSLVRSLLSPSSFSPISVQRSPACWLSRSLHREPQRRRLQECTKCSALTGARPVPLLPLVYFGRARARARVFLPSPGAFFYTPSLHLFLRRFFLSFLGRWIRLSVWDRERKRAGSLLYSCAWSCILYPLDGSAAPFVVPIVARRRPSIPTPRPTRFFHYSTPVRTFTPSLRVFGPCPCARHGPVRSLLTLYGEASGMRYLAIKVTRILRSLYLMFLSSLYSVPFFSRISYNNISNRASPIISFHFIFFSFSFLFFFPLFFCYFPIVNYQVSIRKAIKIQP